MKLYHGSFESDAPVIKIGEFAMHGDNVFDGIFSSADSDIAGSHGRFVHCYNVELVADSSELNDRISDVIEFLCNELESDDVDGAVYAIANDECD
ncbi:TPA: hypothetical protein ACS3VH_001049 [Klebsiella oxytoca]